MEHIKVWLDQYGYIVLFLGLLLELVALPVPGEVLMSYSGFLVHEGRLNWLTTILSAGLGSSSGITIAYLVGRKLGAPFFHKYGRRIHMGPENLEKISHWFARFGNKVLLVGFFIPGVRHVTGYFAGITQIPFRTFAWNAYTGAFFWTVTFVSLGKLLGPKWEQFHGALKKYLILGGLVLVAVTAGIYFYRAYRQQIRETAAAILAKAAATFHSLGRVKLLVTGMAAAFIGLFIVMLGLIQDYLAHEFEQFDIIGSFLVHGIFDQAWTPWMQKFSLLASFRVLLPVMLLTLLWIWRKGQNRRLETGFLVSVMVGGEILDEGLRRLFHRSGPAESLGMGGVPFTFPSEQSLMALAVFGFAAYLLTRHAKKSWTSTFAWSVVLAVSLFVGISRVYLNVQYPSDVTAGYVFGGVWLSLNIVILEIFRLLRKNDII